MSDVNLPDDLVAWTERMVSEGRYPTERDAVIAAVRRAASVGAALRGAPDMAVDLAWRAAGVGIWDWDITSNAIVYSEGAKRIYGFAPDQPVTFEMVRAATHPEDQPHTTDLRRRALDPEIRAVEPYEFRIVRPDGTVRWVLAHGEVLFARRDGRDEAVRYLGTVQDLTERKLAEERGRDGERRLRLALEAGQMGIWEWTATTGEVVGSPELYRLLGFSEDARPDRARLEAGYLPGEQERVRAAALAAMERGDPHFEAEFRYRGGDGRMRWILLRADIRMGAGQKPDSILGVALDITDRQSAVEQKQLLIDELNHRVKNTLATVVSVAAQTLRKADNLASARTDLEARLIALARAHDALTRENWSGAELGDLIRHVVGPHALERLTTGGPTVRLPPRLALGLAMALHELTTNAVRHGALSADGGRVRVEWSLAVSEARPRFELIWSESGGPPVAPPSRRGFGTAVIARGLTHEFDATTELSFDPTGVTCRISVPL